MAPEATDEGWTDPRINVGPDEDAPDLVAVLTNSIGYEMFKDDGREVTLNDRGIETIVLSDEETARARSIAERCVRDLQELL